MRMIGGTLLLWLGFVSPEPAAGPLQSVGETVMALYSTEEVYVTEGPDYLSAPEFGSTLDLNGGLDFVTVRDNFDDYVFDFEPSTSTVVVTDKFAPAQTFTLIDDERLVFNDAVVAFDIDGAAP